MPEIHLGSLPRDSAREMGAPGVPGTGDKGSGGKPGTLDPKAEVEAPPRYGLDIARRHRQVSGALASGSGMSASTRAWGANGGGVEACGGCKQLQPTPAHSGKALLQESCGDSRCLQLLGRGFGVFGSCTSHGSFNMCVVGNVAR